MMMRNLLCKYSRHFRYLTLALFVCLIYISMYFFNDKRSVSKSKVENCLQEIVTVQIGSGRLGNKIFEYATVWSMAKMYGFRPFVPRIVFHAVNAVFDDLSVPSISALEKELQESEMAKCRFLNEYTILQQSTAYKRNLSVHEFVREAKETGKPIILRISIALASTVVPLLKDLKSEFRFRAQYSQNAQKILTDIRQQLLTTVGNDNQVVFIGIHVRRTDYNNYLKHGFHLKKIAEVGYYCRAVAWMRTNLANEETRTLNMAFVVVSDDIKWCSKKLLPALYSQEQNRTDLGGFGAYIGGHGNISSPIGDLALLSMCNHSVISYGTFGMWGALMAGGKTVLYDIRRDEANINVTKTNNAIEWAEKVPGWVLMT